MNEMIMNSKSALTMSSLEISRLVESRHDNVKIAIDRLVARGVIHQPAMQDGIKASNGVTTSEYLVKKRDSYVVVAQLSPEFTARLVDRWQELEEQLAPQVPTNFATALQLAADQAKQLELAAPKVAFVENLVERHTLMTATQIAQKHGMSAVKLNRLLDELGGVYSKSVKRGRAFIQSFIDNGYGELKQTEHGHSQCLFSTAGEVWIHSKLVSEGVC
ncbi:Rha family transcriptional regulator [Neptunomonas japonica]|uniref:DNA-binding protein n=1 Tax=Neptunomonas japonica JAMM 1380 TaxID=1441457 RepID=A0A7R6SW55_9GAMM|nr:phage antirepressor KilAC domain-containing protein [Neptunomonas japonica]BBB29357.1 DNA-binding protein [Neptunomonas japonica JAMM 1380]